MKSPSGNSSHYPLVAYVTDNALWIRLEGGEGSVKAARELLGGEEVADQFWQQLREQQLPFFSLPVPYGAFHYPAMRR